MKWWTHSETERRCACRRGWLKKEGKQGEREKCIEGMRRRGGESSSPEVLLVLQYLLPQCSKWKKEGEDFGQKPQSLILIKKHKEHQRVTPNLYQSGAPTIPMILKLLGAIQCQVLRQELGLCDSRFGGLWGLEGHSKVWTNFSSSQWLPTLKSSRQW